MAPPTTPFDLRKAYQDIITILRYFLHDVSPNERDAAQQTYDKYAPAKPLLPPAAITALDTCLLLAAHVPTPPAPSKDDIRRIIKTLQKLTTNQ